jgi:hypothetical protein
MKSAEELAPVVRDFAESIGLFDPAREIVGRWTDRLMIRRRLTGVNRGLRRRAHRRPQTA